MIANEECPGRNLRSDHPWKVTFHRIPFASTVATFLFCHCFISVGCSVCLVLYLESLALWAVINTYILSSLYYLEGAPTGFHCAFSQIIEFWDTRITSGTLSIQPWKLSGEFVIRDPSLWGDLAISISVALLVLGRSHLAPAQCQGLIGQWLKGAQVPIWDLKHCFRGLHSTGFCFLRLNIGSKLSGVLLKLHVFLSLVGHLWHLFKP